MWVCFSTPREPEPQPPAPEEAAPEEPAPAGKPAKAAKPTK